MSYGSELTLILPGVDQRFKRAKPRINFLQPLNLRHHLLFFMRDGFARYVPRQRLIPVVTEDRLHLLEFETQLLCALDECQQLNGLLAVDAVPAFALRRR